MGISQPSRTSKKKDSSRHRQYKKWVNKLQSKKEIIELESYKKSKILKKYAKLCAAEGIQSSRVNVPSAANVKNNDHIMGNGADISHEESTNELECTKNDQCENDMEPSGSRKGKKTMKKKKVHLNALEKAHLTFQQKSKNVNSHTVSQECVQVGKSGSTDSGKQKGKRRIRRETKKGQPIMKNQITQMLHAIQTNN